MQGQRSGIVLGVALAASAALAVLLFRPLLFPPPDRGAEALAADRPTAALTVFYHERRPYYFWKDGRLQGVVGEIAWRALQDSGVPHEWREAPPARQLAILRESAARCAAVGWFQNEERRAYAQFSMPLYRDRPTVVLARADDARLGRQGTTERLLTEPGLRLLVKEAYSYGPWLDALIARHQPAAIRTATGNEGMSRMVEASRADYFFAAAEEAVELLTRTGAEATGLRVLEFADMPPGNERHLMLSRAVADVDVERINAAIGRLTAARPATPGNE